MNPPFPSAKWLMTAGIFCIIVDDTPFAMDAEISVAWLRTGTNTMPDTVQVLARSTRQVTGQKGQAPFSTQKPDLDPDQRSDSPSTRPSVGNLTSMFLSTALLNFLSIASLSSHLAASSLSNTTSIISRSCGTAHVCQISVVNKPKSDALYGHERFGIMRHYRGDSDEADVLARFDLIPKSSYACQLELFPGLGSELPELGGLQMDVFLLGEHMPAGGMSWDQALGHESYIGSVTQSANTTVQAPIVINTVVCKPTLCFRLAVTRTMEMSDVQVADMFRRTLRIVYNC